MTADRPVTLAAIAGAHGVRGEVRLKLFGEGAETLRAFSVFAAGDRKLTLKSIRPANQGAVATFAEITDRSGAEALRGGGGVGSSLARRSASSAPSLADPGRRFKSARPSSSVTANAIRSPVASATRPVTTPCRCAAPADAPGAPAGSRTVTCRLSRRREATAVRFPLDAAHASRRSRPSMQTSLCSPSCSRSGRGSPCPARASAGSCGPRGSPRRAGIGAGRSLA